MSELKTHFNLTPQETAWSVELTGVADQYLQYGHSLSDGASLLSHLRSAHAQGLQVTVIAEHPDAHVSHSPPTSASISEAVEEVTTQLEGAH